MTKKIIYIILIFSLYFSANIWPNDQLKNYFQQHLVNKKICLVLNPGNAGDALIWYGTHCFLKRMGIKYITSNNEKDILSPNMDVVIYSGAGNLVPYYKFLAQFLKKYMHKVKKLILLPQTIQGHQGIVKQLPTHVDVFCREYMSYNYCKKIVPHPKNVTFSHDMAFYADLDDFKKNFNMPKNGPFKDLFAFRMDSERNSNRKNIVLPKSNVDISKLGTIRPGHSFKKCMHTAYEFLSRIMPYETVWTDRLHVGIAGFLLGKCVHLFDNSYGKNKAIYEASIKPNDKLNLVTFHGQDFKPLQLHLKASNS